MGEMMIRCLVVGVAVLVLGVAACGGGGKPSGDAARIVVSETSPAAGDAIGARVVAPDVDTYSYGLATTLERRGADGGWTAVYRLALGEDAEGAAHARIGNEALAVLDIAYTDDREWTVVIPPAVAPGDYRIAADVLLGEDMAPAIAHSPVLSVGG